MAVTTHTFLVAGVVLVAVILVLPAIVQSATAAPASTSTVAPTSTDEDGSLRAAAGAAAPVAGAVYTEETFTGFSSVWGHDDSLGGVNALNESAFARLDLHRALLDHTTSVNCRRALVRLLQARSELKLWALQMHTSSVVLPEALLSGAMVDMGDYDTCMSLPDSMYCLMDVEVRPLSAGSPHALDEESPFLPPNGINATYWDLLKISGNRRRFRRDNQQWAMCLPAQCSHTDFRVGSYPTGDGVRQLGSELALALGGVGRSLGVLLRLHLRASDCPMNQANEGSQTNHTKEKREQLVVEWLFNQPILFFGSLFILMFPFITIIATARLEFKKHITGSGEFKEENGILPSILNCFAIQKNWKGLGRVHKKSQINSIQGLRVITMAGVVMGHRALFPLGIPIFNPEIFENAYEQPLKMFLICGHAIVGVFFIIGAFLEAHICMKVFQKTKKLNLMMLLQMYINRYIRLVPALGVMIAFQALWMDGLGSGPIWNQIVGEEAQLCRTYWWSHLLFLNNYYNPGTQCLPQTWYVAATFHMYMATPLAMWIVYRSTRKSLWPGFVFLGLLLAVSMIVLYARTAALQLLPTSIPFPMIVRNKNSANNLNFIYQYLPTHMNLVPYIVGLIFGTIYHVVNSREWKPSRGMRKLLLIGVPVNLVVQSAAIVAGIYLIKPEVSNPWISSLAAPARIFVFSIASSYLVFVSTIGCGGAYESLLIWKPFVILGRLTYCVYLVHLTWLYGSLGSIRQPYVLSEIPFYHAFLGDLVMSYLFALILHLCVEAPMYRLQKALHEGDRKSEDKPSPACDGDFPRTQQVHLDIPVVNNGDRDPCTLSARQLSPVVQTAKL